MRHFYLQMKQPTHTSMSAETKNIKRVKIRLHELRETSDAAELERFLARRKGIIKVEVVTDYFSITVTYDARVTSPAQIMADLSSIRFTPEGSTLLNV
jgi:hypothetical protein